MQVFQGIGIVRGIATGKIYEVKRDKAAVEEYSGDVNPSHEWQRILQAKADTETQLAQLAERTGCELGETAASIICAQQFILVDEDFLAVLNEKVWQEKNTATVAVSQAGEQFLSHLKSLDDSYVRARIGDVEDVINRLMDNLRVNTLVPNFTAHVIVVADDLRPSEITQYFSEKVKGFVVRNGTPNSHTAILARMMDVPCIFKAELPQETHLSGREISIDGETGVCYLEADYDTSVMLATKERTEARRRESRSMLRGLPTITKGGKELKLLASISNITELESAIKNDAEGIGLFRSEFLYMGRKDYPTEDELYEVFRKMAEQMAGKKVIIRTMDFSTDKRADYLLSLKENNVVFGFRGIRVSFDHPELFEIELRAIYRAAAYGRVAMMFPLITSVWEVQRIKEMAANARRQLTEAKIATGDVEIGIMIETPAAAIIADMLAKEVDFFSVGTNDLTRFTLAVERTSNQLRQYYDPYHPAVLRMLRMVAESAKRAGIDIGMCGELAADPEITHELIKMGYDELSLPPALILETRERVRDIR
ncbi:MAG: phosphoenolpyruvate--protein phosphotransferase [Lachnospiraceae bacterium]|jgi:phosphotransferase system enzyme I (PtsI)|nr:phosphoenolpyruvate--protein phosphotransferase [Lachnospiraceae bacterium]